MVPLAGLPFLPGANPPASGTSKAPTSRTEKQGPPETFSDCLRNETSRCQSKSKRETDDRQTDEPQENSKHDEVKDDFTTASANPAASTPVKTPAPPLLDAQPEVVLAQAAIVEVDWTSLPLLPNRFVAPQVAESTPRGALPPDLLQAVETKAIEAVSVPLEPNALEVGVNVEMQIGETIRPDEQAIKFQAPLPGSQVSNFALDSAIAKQSEGLLPGDEAFAPARSFEISPRKLTAFDQSSIDSKTPAVISPAAIDQRIPVITTKPFDAASPIAWQQAVDQIVAEAPLSLRANGEAEFRFRISPPDIGPIHIRLAHSGSGVTAELTVTSEAVRQIVESRLSELHRRFETAGIGTNGFTVQLIHDDARQSHGNAFAFWQSAADGRGEWPIRPARSRGRSMLGVTGVVDVTA